MSEDTRIKVLFIVAFISTVAFLAYQISYISNVIKEEGGARNIIVNIGREIKSISEDISKSEQETK